MRIVRIVKNRKGFTLIEIIIYFTILSAILLIVTDLFLRISEGSLEGTSKSRVEVEGEYVLKRLNFDIRRAQEVVDPPDPGGSSPSLWLRIGGIDYKYTLAGSVVNLQVAAGSPTPITGNSVKASSLNFTHIANPNGVPTILIKFTLEGPAARQGPKTKNFETVVGLR